MSIGSLPFHRRLVGRLVLFGLVPVLVVIGIVAGLNATRDFRAFDERTREELKDATREAAREVSAQNQRVALLASAIGRAQVDGGMFGRRAETLAYLRGLVLAHPDLAGVYVVYEPNADGNDAATRTTLPSGAVDEHGRFAPYWRRDPASADGIRLEANVGMEDYPNFLFYLGPRKHWEATGKAETIFTKPYEYQGVEIIEQTFPLIRGGKFVGISGVDRSLAQVGAVLSSIGTELGGECFLTTRSIDGIERFLAATVDRDATPDQRLQTRSVAGTPYEALLARAPSEPGTVLLLDEIDPVLNERCYYGITRTEVGGFSLLVRRPLRELRASTMTALAGNGAIALTGTVVISIVLLSLFNAVGRRLQTAIQAAERIAAGDLTQELAATDARDESGVLLNMFASMGANLSRVARELRRASIQINSTSTELGASAVEQESVASSLSSSATQVAAATQEIAATGTELVRTMDEIAKSAAGAGSQASEGRSSVRAMHDALQRLDEAARSVGSKLEMISEKTKGISTILATITRVAEQTNLLSVNAAIEAERAGELGLGFLVVAREIRRLADQTADATLDIERVVHQMQDAVGGGVMEMDRFGGSLRACVTEGETLGKRLEDIVAHVEFDTQRVGQVTEGMRTQSAGVSQIDEAMRSLSASAKQSRTAAADFAKASSALQGAIDTLKTAVAAFRLRD
ncbi:MAG: methyl-accepting chemotaxis protein [Phycisphaerales bacterium]